MRSGPLEIVATVDGPELVDMAAQKEERLCDACFNYHSLHEYEEPPVATPPVLRASSSGGGFGGSPNSSLEPPAVVQTSQDLPSDREQLMDGARGQSLPAEGSALSAAGAARCGHAARSACTTFATCPRGPWLHLTISLMRWFRCTCCTLQRGA